MEKVTPEPVEGPSPEPVEAPKDKVIEGAILYRIIIDPTNKWKIEYESTLENDVAAIGIAQYISETIVASLQREKKIAKGVHNQNVATMLRKAINARFGLKLMLDHMQANYLRYKASKEAELKALQEAEVPSFPADETKLDDEAVAILAPKLEIVKDEETPLEG